LLMLGACLLPLFPGRLKIGWMLALPVLSFLQLLQLPDGALIQFTLFDYTLTPVRVDRLSLIFGYVFHLAAFLSALYAAHVKDTVQHVAGLIYAGSAIAAVFAGDMISLFVNWELTAVSSVFLIWASRTEAAFRVGMRYMLIQVGSGVILLAGVLLIVADTGSLEFSRQALVGAAPDALGLDWRAFPAGAKLVLLAFGIKAAFPFLHNWLQDAYPHGTATGTVFLSAFTTKLAIYALARGFYGTEALIAVGCVMTIFPIFFAVIENDLRRVLAYSLNNQLGFMVVGVGVGTALALNGAAAHAFAHIIYKGLLFMAMGAVLHRCGTTRASELGGLYKSMPFTTVFCIIGAMSISAFPLMSGFTTKSMTMTAVADMHLLVPWLVLTAASAGVMEHSGIKIPFFAFFAHDSGKRPDEAPLNMLLAMGIAAFICVFVGVYPAPLYALLPFEIEPYVAYTATHVVTQLQLLFFAMLAFGWLMRRGLYPAEVRSLNLDFDWIYRRALPALVRALNRAFGGLWARSIQSALAGIERAVERVYKHHGPEGALARTWPTGSIALWAAILLGGYLVLFYI